MRLGKICLRVNSPALVRTFMKRVPNGKSAETLNPYMRDGLCERSGPSPSITEHSAPKLGRPPLPRTAASRPPTRMSLKCRSECEEPKFIRCRRRANMNGFVRPAPDECVPPQSYRPYG